MKNQIDFEKLDSSDTKTIEAYAKETGLEQYDRPDNLQSFPIKTKNKILGMFGQKQYNTEEFNIKKVKKLLGQDKIDKEQILTEILKIEENFTKKITDRKPKDPLLFLIRQNNDVEIKENIKPGVIKFKRSDNRHGLLILPQSKLLVSNWGNNIIRFWLAEENLALALPFKTEVDGAQIHDWITTVISNHKNYEHKSLVEKRKMLEVIMYAIIAIVVITFFVLPFFSINPFAFFFPPPETVAEEGTKQLINITDTNVNTT